jgi:hypothetical protein
LTAFKVMRPDPVVEFSARLLSAIEVAVQAIDSSGERSALLGGVRVDAQRRAISRWMRSNVRTG